MRLTIVKIIIRAMGLYAGLLGLGMLSLLPFVIHDAIVEKQAWIIVLAVLLFPLAAYFIYAAYLIWSPRGLAEETERLGAVRPRRCWVSLAVFCVRCLWWRRRVVLAAGLICLVATVVITWVQPRVYSSRVRIVVAPASEGDVIQP